MPAEAWGTVARFHRRFRYVGIGLFAVAVLVWVGVFVAVGTGRLAAGNVVLGFGGVILSLSAFGASNDTALHAALQLPAAQLGPELAAELALERRRRPKRLASVHGSPKMAWALLFGALAVLSLLGWRLLQAWA